MVVWKFDITHGRFTRMIPRDAKFLGVGQSRRDPCFWVLVHPESEMVQRNFHALFTGEEYDFLEGEMYRGTTTVTTLGNRGLETDTVYHLFEMNMGAKW